MVEAIMISDYRADVETSLSLAKVLLMLMLICQNADADETHGDDAQCKFPHTDKYFLNSKNKILLRTRSST